jgi:glutathione S-transferase
LSNSAYVAVDELTLADISFACDLTQFLFELRSREALEAKGLTPVSDSLANYGHALRHLLALGERPAFASTVGSTLDRHRTHFEH